MKIIPGVVRQAEWALHLVRLTGTAGYYIDLDRGKKVCRCEKWCGGCAPPGRTLHHIKVGASITPDFWDKGQNTLNPHKYWI